MPLHVYQRPSGVFHIRGTHYGERIDRSSGSRSEREARIVADKWEAEIFERYVKGERAVCTFAQAAAGYMRGGGERTHLTPLLHAFGTMRLRDISQGDLDAFAAHYLPHAKPSSRLRMVYTPFIAVWNWAVADGKADPRVWRKPSAGLGRVDWRTPAEIEALLAACAPSLAALVTFYVGTGARGSEALALDWRDVSPAAQRVTLWETKAGYARHVDLIDRVRSALPARSQGPVFVTEALQPWSDLRGVNQALERASKRAKIRHTSCHVLRHTWATWSYALRRDIPWLMAHGGWRSVTMVMRYVHLGTDDLADDIRAAGWEISGKPDTPPIKIASK